MRGTRIAALIMTGVMLVEAWPLWWIAVGPHGFAKLAKLLGWHTPPISLLAWVMGLAAALGYAACLPFIRQHVTDLTALKLLALPFALITGSFEELFFRKYIMDLTASNGASVPLQILASGMAFGLAHAIWGLLGRNLRAAAAAMAFTTGLGLALAVVYIVAARQLAPAAWSHILINLIIEPWLILGIMQLRLTTTEGWR
jgi:hypothetical protein